jgi:hypothetical protein
MNIATMLIISQHISQNPNDEQDVTSALQMLSRLPEELGSITKAAADSGLFIKITPNHSRRQALILACPMIANITAQRRKSVLQKHPKRRKRRFGGRVGAPHEDRNR